MGVRAAPLKPWLIFFTMKSWKQYGTTHQPIESFSLMKEGVEQHFLIVEMRVKGVKDLYLGLFKDTKCIRKNRKETTKKFISNFRVVENLLSKEQAIQKLKAKVS